MLHRCANGILTPLATPASEALPSAIVHLLRGITRGSEDCSDSCIRKALVLVSSLSTTLSTRGSPGRCGRARPCRAGIVTGDPVCVVVGLTRHLVEEKVVLRQREAMTMASSDFDQSPSSPEEDGGIGVEEQPCP